MKDNIFIASRTMKSVPKITLNYRLKIPIWT